MPRYFPARLTDAHHVSYGRARSLVIDNSIVLTTTKTVFIEGQGGTVGDIDSAFFEVDVHNQRDMHVNAELYIAYKLPQVQPQERQYVPSVFSVDVFAVLQGDIRIDAGLLTLPQGFLGDLGMNVAVSQGGRVNVYTAVASNAISTGVSALTDPIAGYEDLSGLDKSIIKPETGTNGSPRIEVINGTERLFVAYPGDDGANLRDYYLCVIFRAGKVPRQVFGLSSSKNQIGVGTRVDLRATLWDRPIDVYDPSAQ